LRRGLCWRCYSNPSTRARFFAPRNLDTRDALDLIEGRDIPAVMAGPCPGPLPGAAGSAERLAALGARADAYVCLFPRCHLSLEAAAALFG
jgi:hypothetical protein